MNNTINIIDTQSHENMLNYKKSAIPEGFDLPNFWFNALPYLKRYRIFGLLIGLSHMRHLRFAVPEVTEDGSLRIFKRHTSERF